MLKIDVRGAAKKAGLTLQRLADAVCVSSHTMHDIAYRRGRTTSIETAYEITCAAGELRIHGPKGTVVMRREVRRLPRVLPLRCDVA